MPSRTSFGEMAAYLVFVFVFSVWVSVSRDVDFSFAFGALVRDQLLGSEFRIAGTQLTKTFHKISTLSDIHSFLLGPFFETLWGGQVGSDGALLHDLVDWGWVLGQSRLIGAPRLRQVRTRTRGCGEG